MTWPFPKRCFCFACFKLLLFSMASMICFSSCTDVFLHLSPNRLADLGIFNVVHLCTSPLHLPAILSQLFGSCWQLVGFLTFVPAGYWNDSLLNHLRSCVTPRVKLVWWNQCEHCKSILDFNLEFSPMMLQLTCIYLFRLEDHFSSLKFGVNPSFPSYHVIITARVGTVDNWNSKEDVWFPCRSIAVLSTLGLRVGDGISVRSQPWPLVIQYLTPQGSKTFPGTISQVS